MKHLVLVALLWMFAAPAHAGEFTVGKDWPEYASDFPNPYRGFYCKTADRLNANGSCAAGTGNVDFFADTTDTNLKRFSNTYNAGLRLVYDRLTIDPSNGTPIPAADIQDIKDNLAATRGTGIKVILRIRPGGSHTSDCRPEIEADANPAAPIAVRNICRTRLENYTKQLADALTGYEDTIAWVEMGGYGDAGEGAKSETFTTSQDPDGGYTDPCLKYNRPACDDTIERWFDFQRRAYSDDIWLTIKKPSLARAWTDKSGSGFDASPEFAITRKTAHDAAVTNSNVAHFNDCITLNRSDAGVYHHPDGYPDKSSYVNEWEKDALYYHQQMKFTFGTGETCASIGGWPNDSTISDCSNATVLPDPKLQPQWKGLRYTHGGAVKHLERLHQMAMENEWSTGQIVHQKWRDQGCHEQITKRLGYRFVPQRLKIPDQLAAGTSMAVEFDVRNDGFARFFKARNVYITLDDGTARADVLLVGEDRTSNDDIRFWPPYHEKQEIRKISKSVVLPDSLAAGTYDVAIWIPDPDFNDRDDANDAKYSIRLAAGTWKPEKGYTVLGTIQVIEN